MNAIHDVSRELRDPHGKWTRGGALKRMASEAASARAPKSAEEIQGHVRNLQKGTGRTIGGHRIDRTQRDKYRVGLRKEGGGRDTKLYDSPEHAAQALHEGKHHEAGGAAKVAGGARTAAADKAVREMAGKAPAGGERHKSGDRVVYTDKRGKEHTATVKRAYTVPRSPEPSQYTIELDQPTGRYQETTRDVPHSALRPAKAPASRPAGAVEHKENALTPSEERIRQASLNKLQGKAPAGGERHKSGDTVTGDGGKWSGKVLETKDTPSGQSVKVQRDDRKIASWYWAKDLANAKAGRPPVKNLADIQRATDTLREQSRMAKQYERDRRAGVPPESRAGAAGRPPARGEIMEGRAPMPERLRPGGGSKNFPNGTHVSIIGGKYSGEDGEVISGGDPLRPGLIQVRRADGSTILVRESNAANAKMSREEMIARQGDYLKKAGAMQPTERQQAINLTTINGQIRRAQDIVEDPASVSKFGQAEVDRQKARLVQLRKRRAAMTQSGPSGSSSLGEVLSKSPRSRQAPRY
jgi:hypothetical protein